MSNIRHCRFLRVRATHACIVVALALAPTSTWAAWSYSESGDPFNDQSKQKLVISLGNQSPTVGFRRFDGADSVDLLIVLSKSREVDPNHSILIRIDSHATQELEASENGHLTVANLLAKDRSTYYYHALALYGSDSEFSWKPNRLAIPVITDIDDRQRTDTVLSYSKDAVNSRLPFDPLTNHAFAPEGLFLQHLLKGQNLFLRYTAIDGSEVTERISLVGLSAPLEQLLTKSTAERCSDEAVRVVAKNGCFERAVDAAQPLPPGLPVFKSPAFKKIFDGCLQDAKRAIPICGR